jgi:hypothetical protein
MVIFHSYVSLPEGNSCIKVQYFYQIPISSSFGTDQLSGHTEKVGWLIIILPKKLP